MRLILIHKNENGFTLIEFLMALVLIAILSVLSINSITNTLNESQFNETVRRLQVIRKGLVGDTTLKQGKTRSDFGFLGDIGAIPTAAQGLSVLFTNPGLPAWSVNTAPRFGLGWNGPYVKTDNTGDTYLKDAWGNSFVYSPTATPPTVVSLGADGTAGGTGYNRDITMQLPANTLTSTVHGFILKGGVQWSGAADIVLNQSDGNGNLTQQTVSITSANNGHFVFSNVPMGVRSATIYVPNKISPTVTLGPSLFTVDQPYYLIQANFFDLAPTAVGPTNIEVPIEMIDYGISSAILGLFTTFERSRTSLNTNDYDGTVTYSFEVVATNIGLLPNLVSIINSAGTTVGTVVLASTANPTRFRSSFTPNTGANNYRLQLPITTLLNELSITSARIIVSQTGATKTKVYMPLIAANTTLVNSTDTVYIDSSSSTTYGQPTPLDYSVWKKNDSVLSLTSGNPFTLEVVLATGTTGGTASAALYDRTSGLAVNGAVVTSTSNALGIQDVSFADTATNFSDQDEFELRIKSSSVLQQAVVAKAGLFIALSSLGSGEVYYRTAKNYTGTASVNLDSQRVLLNTSLFSNVSAFAETVCSSTTASGTSVSLVDALTTDSGTTGTAVTGSSLTAATTKSRQRSGALSLTSSDRFIDKITTTSATSNVSSGVVVVQFHY
jgi:prepilin-type N-terminal cleavage/methylation domain-containing protein